MDGFFAAANRLVSLMISGDLRRDLQAPFSRKRGLFG